MLKITFSDNITTKKYILSLLDKSINDEGIIIDKKGMPVIDIDGNEITIDEFGLVSSGSEIFVKDNIISLFKYNEKYSKL